MRLQAAALVVVGDLARDAHVLDRGHEDEVAAGQGDVGGDARALVAERLLHHLHQDVLALRAGAPRWARRGATSAVAAPRLLLGRRAGSREVLEHVGDVEERVALEAERRRRRTACRAAPG